MKIFSTKIFIMQPNTWKYFPFRKIAFSENIYFPENILWQPNTALNTHTLTSTFTRRPPLQTTPSHHHFSSKITGKILKNPKASSSFLFEVKISHLFGGFYTFTWGYFYLSFNNDTHVIYEHWKWYSCVYMYEFWSWWMYLMSVFMIFTMMAI